MDALSDVLRVVRLNAAVFLDAEFTAPWCVGEPSGVEVCIQAMPRAQHVVIYHMVTEGSVNVAVRGEAPRYAEAGDLIVIPSGEPHSLGSDLSLPQASGAKLVIDRGPDEVGQVRHGGGGAPTKLVCGYLACDSSLFNAVLAPLPRVMIVNMREGTSATWLTESLRFGISEVGTQRAGAGTVLAKLSELMFVEALRRYIESLPAEHTGWLAGLRDRFVGKTLALIHAKPKHPWTVEDLAEEVGLSRSALAEKFTELVGVPPMQYLTKWRLQLAADMLRSSARSVAAVAGDVGYDSESAFSRAFKRELGIGPSGWRQGQDATTDDVTDK